jgi:hypothetical protein
MGTTMIVCGPVPLLLLLIWIISRFDPPEFSEVGARHFAKGFLFAGLSSAALLLAFSLEHHLAQLFLLVLFFAGSVCNGISVFCFMRELLPGGEITPQGTSAGVLMVIEQGLWLLFGALVLVSNGF